jgi:hypothetical protein
MAAKAITIRDYHTEIPGELSPDRKTWLFPQINSVNAHGKNTEWRICVKLFRVSDKIVLSDIPDNEFIPILDTYFDNT